MTIALVTDSTAYLPNELLDAHGIRSVPLHVIIGGTERQEGVDVTADEVAEALRSFAIVTTSKPAPAAFLAAYEAAAADGANGIVSVHISSDMSSTISSAHLAASESPVPVTVLDSRTLGMAMGYAVIAAAEAAAAGEGLEMVAEVAMARAAAATAVFYVDTLEYLRRGGRIGGASAFLGTRLAIKPILTVADGRIHPLEKVRTAAKALARLEALAVQAAAAAGDTGVDIAVHHLDSPDRAVALRDRLRGAVTNVHDLRIVELGAVVGAHVGPGTLAVAVSPRLS